MRSKTGMSKMLVLNVIPLVQLNKSYCLYVFTNKHQNGIGSPRSKAYNFEATWYFFMIFNGDDHPAILVELTHGYNVL